MTAGILHRYGVEETPEQRQWFAVAEQVAQKLAQDVTERDAANQPPFAEVELLRGSGLLPLTIPAKYGGAGIGWRTALEIVQRIARVDNSIGQLLGYHYIFQAFPYIDLPPERASALAAASAKGQWLYSSTGTPQGPQAAARRVDGGFIINGKKPFSTGSRVADRIYGRAIDERGSRLALLIDTAWEGIVRHDDWDVLGSRLTATNTIEFRNVFVPDEHILAKSRRERCRAGAPSSADHP